MQTLELERLVVSLIGDGTSYQKMLKDAEATTTQAAGKVQGIGQGIEGFGNSLVSFASAAAGAVTTLLATVGIGSVFDTFKKSISLASAAEENEIAFGVMLHSVDKGKEMVKQLQDFAAVTPLDATNLQQASKTLLQFGIAGENVLPILKMLGDVTGGNAERLQRMSLAFGEVASAGRLTGHHVLQMVNAGFNPLQVMAKKAAETLGGSVAENMIRLKKEMEAGQISINMVADAFKIATSEGGDFFDGMEKQSQGIGGLFSTMQDDIDATLRSIGYSLVEGLGLKDLMRAVSAVAQEFQKWFLSIDKESRTAIITFAAIATAVTLIALSVAGVVVSLFLANVAATALNISLGGIPFIIGGIVAVVAVASTAIYAWTQSVGGLSKAWKKVADAALWTWNAIGDAINVTWRTLQPFVTILSDFWTDITKLAVDAWKEIETAAGPTLKEIYQLGVDAFKWLYPLSGDWLSLMATILKSGLGTFFYLLQGVVTTVKGIIQIALETKQAFDKTWNDIFGGARQYWGDIGRTIQDTLMLAEFSILNFSKVAEFTWVRIRLGAASLVEDLKHWFTIVLPAQIKYFAETAREMFFGTFKAVFSVVQAMADATGDVIKTMVESLNALKALSEGKLTLDEFLKSIDPKKIQAALDNISPQKLSEKIKGAFNLPEAPKIPIRVETPTESGLRLKFENLTDQLAKDIEEFSQQKDFERMLRQMEQAFDNFKFPDEAKEKMKIGAFNLGEDMGKEMGKGLKKEMGKWDAAGFYSAEAVFRIAQYRDLMGVKPQIPKNNFTPDVLGPKLTTQPIDLKSVPQLTAPGGQGPSMQRGEPFSLKDVADGITQISSMFGTKLDLVNQTFMNTVYGTRDALIARLLTFVTTVQPIVTPIQEANLKLNVLSEIKNDTGMLVAQSSNPIPSPGEKETNVKLTEIKGVLENILFAVGSSPTAPGLN